MDGGYDAGNGDWWYGVYAADGRSAKMQGSLSACIKCHAGADSDYLFTNEVLSH